jgi:phage repressor protein C with HTH and peptisase S24 domain
MEVMSFRVACGDFIGESDVERDELEKPGFALIPRGMPQETGMFAVRGRGDSMTPTIPNGHWCVFTPDPVGSREGRVVIVEQQTRVGPTYTLKRYHSVKHYSKDGESWRHVEIRLDSLNRNHGPIYLNKDTDYSIHGWYVGHVESLQRVERPEFESL